MNGKLPNQNQTKLFCPILKDRCEIESLKKIVNSALIVNQFISNSPNIQNTD